MHRVLKIPEILHHILKELQQSDQARAGRVCVAWSAVALRLVWENLDDWIDLFSVAGKIHNGVSDMFVEATCANLTFLITGVRASSNQGRVGEVFPIREPCSAS
jgi:hypothetical protein